MSLSQLNFARENQVDDQEENEDYWGDHPTGDKCTLNIKILDAIDIPKNLSLKKDTEPDLYVMIKYRGIHYIAHKSPETNQPIFNRTF